MSDDDDLDKFLKEMEEDESLNSTVVAKNNFNTRSVADGKTKDAKDLETDDVLEEADLFLQELENTEPLRKQMFTETEPSMSSTPILLEKFKSRLDKKSLSASKSKDDSIKDDKKNEVVKKDNSENGKDEIIKDVASILADRSSIMAGNLFSDIDMNDAYLLDEEDDDELEYAKELTIDQLLELEGLLDGSDDESESDILEVTVVQKVDKDETVTEDQVPKTMEGKKVASVQPTEKPADNSTLPPQPPIAEKSKKTEKFDMNVVKNIRYDYYNELKRMYRKYLDCEPPDYNLVREPRIFRDKFSKIIGYEKLDEYLDNNHPMWMEDRKMFAYFIHDRCDNRDVAKFIRDKWNTGLHIDLCQNLTSIPRIKYEERDKESVYIMPVQEEKTFDQTYVYKDVKSALKSMHDTVKNHGTSDAQEKERYDEFNSTIKEDGNNDDDVVFVMSQKKADGCDYCLDFCLCGSQRTAAKLMEEQNSGRKRKRTNSAGESSNKRHHTNPPRKILRRDEIVNTIYNQNRHMRMDEIAKLVKSAEDVLEFNWCYTQGETMSRQMIQELASLEVVYKGFEYYYSSPYQGNNNKGKGKSDSGAKKPGTSQSNSKPGGQKDKPDRPGSRSSTGGGARSGSRSSIDRPGSGCANTADNRPGSSASRPGSRASNGRPGSGAGSARSDSPQVMIEDY